VKGEAKMPECDELTSKCSHDECIFLEGNQIEFEVKKGDCEIRADIPVQEMRCVRVWGEVRNCKGEPVEDALVKLAKVTCKEGKEKLEGVAHTVTDCKGFYQFDICQKEEECEKEEKQIYRIIVGKAAIGKERKIFRTECEPCKDE
jgi:hypothetical protein